MNKSLEKTVEYVDSLKTGNKQLDCKLVDWLVWDKNTTTTREIQNLVRDKKWPVLSERLVDRLHFGTSGLRGQLQAGFNAMNDLVIIQTAQGLAIYILDTYPNDFCRGVAIGFDGRNQSERFAMLTATIFLNAKIPVYLFSTTVPTPFLSYCVKLKKCLAGIMITASHNPKEDNGFKCYWTNSASILSPHDTNIENSILNNLEPCGNSWDTSQVMNSDMVADPLDDVIESYFKQLKTIIPCKFRQLNQFCPIRFVYSAMHGVGYPYFVRGIEMFNLKRFTFVKEQIDPDPEFPTVKFPNPEEAPCFKLAMAFADTNNSSVILINDPDADRLAVAEKQANGEWRIFSGNEIGSLLGWWAMICYRELNPGCHMKNCCMLASTVSSKLLKSMANIEGFKFEETLTGFKWMGNRACELTECECCKWHFLFAFEESIGFMVSPTVYDKDGISAAIHVATLASYLEHFDSKTLSEKLQELYEKYGYHFTLQSYFWCRKPETIKKIFDRIRNWDSKPTKYPESICKGKFKIRSIRDLPMRIDTSRCDGKPILPVDGKNEMITFTFDNEAIITIRTSGTEPKIKYYSELNGKPGNKDQAGIRATLNEMVNGIVQEFLQPKENLLEPQHGVPTTDVPIKVEKK